MKQCFLLVFVTFLSILVVTPISAITSFAVDTTESSSSSKFSFDKISPEKDEQGHITNGVSHHESYATDKITFVTDILIDCSDGAYCYFLEFTSGNYSLITVNGDTVISGAQICYGGNEISYTVPVNSTITESLSAGFWVRDNYFYTNIPIFKNGDTESIEKYINDGDYSGAENAEEVDKAIAGSNENIEAPQGVKVSGGYATGLSSAYSFAHDFVASWSQTVDTTEYVYDVQAKCTISLVSKSGSTVLTGESYGSDWIDYGTKNYSGATNITHSITKDNLNDKLLESALANAMNKSGKKLTYKGYLISKLQIRVRNRVADKCSDWYVVTIDYDSTSTTGTVEDDEGNVIEDDGNIADTNDDDSSTGESIESNISAILNYIRSGFGLLGNTGIISLMSKCFLYLPASIWTMLKFLIAMTVTMSVIGLIKKFVF